MQFTTILATAILATTSVLATPAFYAEKRQQAVCLAAPVTPTSNAYFIDICDSNVGYDADKDPDSEGEEEDRIKAWVDNMIIEVTG
ncbi:hypothetical protein K432DRAFT_408035 [Lepidopterella palustris CBS 459.81]|uniref:Uncharacterized protein n=1 Tax=Lepidopterella palustris CBS 459.81 TaxID=1314670 RepID=A0A8E2E3G1_9PEZI|nr:hypothetical protein K432DRAFT_408035 [Lepidopterella palustris CBS 459.81]